MRQQIAAIQTVPFFIRDIVKKRKSIFRNGSLVQSLRDILYELFVLVWERPTLLRKLCVSHSDCLLRQAPDRRNDGMIKHNHSAVQVIEIYPCLLYSFITCNYFDAILSFFSVTFTQQQLSRMIKVLSFRVQYFKSAF